MSLTDRVGEVIITNLRKATLVASVALIAFGAGEYVCHSTSTNPAGLSEVVTGTLIYLFGEFAHGSIIQPSLDYRNNLRRGQ